MALSSSSTTDDVLAAYADNASYEEDADTAKCKAFISACRLLLSPAHLPRKTGAGGNEVELVPEVIERRMDDARRWLAAQIAATSGGCTHLDLTGFRD